MTRFRLALVLVPLARLVAGAAAIVVTLIVARSADAQVIDFRDLAVEQGQDPVALPSPEAIIERHIEVTGGRAAYERIQNRKVTGTFRQSNRDSTSAITMYEAAPGRRYVRVGNAGGGSVAYITNTEESWTYDGDTVVASGGDQRTQEIRRVAFNMLLDFRRHYPLARTIGIEPVGGRPAYKVRLIAEDCHKVFLFFDKETGRHIRSVQDVAYAGDSIATDATLADYEWIDGVEVPTRTSRVLRYRGTRFVQEYVFTSFENNVELDETMFDTPPELRAVPAPEPSE